MIHVAKFERILESHSFDAWNVGLTRYELPIDQFYYFRPIYIAVLLQNQCIIRVNAQKFEFQSTKKILRGIVC